MSIRNYLEILNIANKKFSNVYSDPDKKQDENTNYIAVAEPNSIEALAGVDGIVTDGDTWDISENEKKIIQKIKDDPTTNTEQKILQVYDYICEKYTYDDNLNYYIVKNDQDEYEIGDWYGKTPTEEWKQNRTKHNKRVCFELSRILAKSVQELIKDKEGYDTCILWDKKNIHYFVGLLGNDYMAILDPDNFNQVKDLTRTKLGLTATGIKVLEDKNNTFTKELEKYNSQKPDKIPEIKELDDQNLPDGEFIKKALEILKEKNIDSHGFYEVAKRIVKSRGISTRNLWKLIGNKRYERCLFFFMSENSRNDYKEESKICIIDCQKKEMNYVDDIDQIDRRVYITKRGGGPVNTYKGDDEDER